MKKDRQSMRARLAKDVNQMVGQAFDKVWFRNPTDKYANMNLKAYSDTGQLVIYDDHIIYHGKKYRFEMRDIRGINYGKVKPDLMNVWVTIEYFSGGALQRAHFSYTVFGKRVSGTKEIFEAAKRVQNRPVTSYQYVQSTGTKVQVVATAQPAQQTAQPILYAETKTDPWILIAAASLAAINGAIALVSCQPCNVVKHIRDVHHTLPWWIEYEEIHRDTC